MSGEPLLRVETRWSCPNCPATDVTFEPRPHTRFHRCAGLLGLDVPFVVDGTACKIEAVERADYVGSDIVQLAGDGRPYMSVITTRDDGQDCTVYAPCASLSASAGRARPGIGALADPACAEGGA